MIIEMTLVRVIGRKAELPRTLAVLQDAGTMHVTEPAEERGVSPPPVSPAGARPAPSRLHAVPWGPHLRLHAFARLLAPSGLSSLGSVHRFD